MNPGAPFPLGWVTLMTLLVTVTWGKGAPGVTVADHRRFQSMWWRVLTQPVGRWRTATHVLNSSCILASVMVWAGKPAQLGLFKRFTNAPSLGTSGHTRLTVALLAGKLTRIAGAKSVTKIV